MDLECTVISVQVLSINGDIELNCIISEGGYLRFDRLEAQSLWSITEFVRASICAKSVRELLKRNVFHHCVYMMIM